MAQAGATPEASQHPLSRAKTQLPYNTFFRTSAFPDS